MLSAMLGESISLLPLKQLIIETTGGTPFFMEETVQALFDEGALKPIGRGRSSWSNRLRRCAFRRPCKPSSPRVSTGCATTRRTSCKLLPCLAANSSSASPEPSPDDRKMSSNASSPTSSSASSSTSSLRSRMSNISSSTLLRRRSPTTRSCWSAASNCMRTWRAPSSCSIPSSLDDHLADLAHHYSRSANQAKAVEYLRLAGMQAMARGSAAPSRAESAKRAHAAEDVPRGPG